MGLKEDPRAYGIVGACMRVHAVLGNGFLESTYGDALEVEFAKRNIPYCREDEIRVYYEGTPLATHYRADFTCFDRQYIVELKAIKTIGANEWAQVLHYMKATRIPAAVLVNFGSPKLQHDYFNHENMKHLAQKAER